MHANFKELLSIRDGAPVSAQAAQHVLGCNSCRLELARLKGLKNELRQLPQFTPPPETWSGIRQELDRLPQRRQNWGWITVSAAAVFGAAIALAFLWSIRPGHGHLVANSPILEREEDRADALPTLVTRSQELEEILHGLPRRPTVQRAATSVAIDQLQTRIQVLDLQLATAANGPPDRVQVNRLWTTRVQLLNSLLYVRYAEAVRDGHGAGFPPISGVI